MLSILLRPAPPRVPELGHRLDTLRILFCKVYCLSAVLSQNIEVITYAVSLIFKAAIIAAKYSGRVRKRSLKRLADMDADAVHKENLFLKDKIYQLETQPAGIILRLR